MERSDPKHFFGVSVKSWRSRLGISQEELAGRAGLHRTYVSDIERGTRNVSLESIDKIARALEVSVATLFSHSDTLALAKQ
jgi:transcriptional regulator with XRE-family HTH domain